VTRDESESSSSPALGISELDWVSLLPPWTLYISNCEHQSGTSEANDHNHKKKADHFFTRFSVKQVATGKQKLYEHRSIYTILTVAKARAAE
jgi:hypothetical protein